MTDTAARALGMGLIGLCLAASLTLHNLLGPDARSPTLTQLLLAFASVLTFLFGLAALVHGRDLFRG